MAYCPHCRTVTNLTASIVPRIVAELGGTTKVVTTRTYHCEVCCSFVRSEEDELISNLSCSICSRRIK